MNLTQYFQQAEVQPALSEVFQHLCKAAQQINLWLRQGTLSEIDQHLNNCNVHGEHQKHMDIVSHQIMLLFLQQSNQVAGVLSEESENPITLNPKAPYLVCMDPLDGSSQLEINGVTGSIISVLPNPSQSQIQEQDFLQPGNSQLAAGYFMYGPALLLVLTVGKGTHVFVLDSQTGEFLLSKAQLSVPEDATEFSINVSNLRHWHAPVKRYIDECLQGDQGVRGRNFNMRWCASMVMDVHRVLCHGGVFLYPNDKRSNLFSGKLRLLYEANPMSLLVTQAGGASIEGQEDLLSLIPEQLHQHISVMMGSASEIERLREYHLLVKESN